MNSLHDLEPLEQDHAFLQCVLFSRDTHGKQENADM